jgi:hypothetical protein
VIINEPYDSYFIHLVAAFAGSDDRTVLLDDVTVRASNLGTTDKAFTFTVHRAREIVDHPVKTDGEGNPQLVELDLRDPDLRDFYFPELPDLQKIIGKQAGDDHYNYYFIPQEDDDKPAADSGKNGQAAAPAEQSPFSGAEQDARQARIDAYRSRKGATAASSSETPPPF